MVYMVSGQHSVSHNMAFYISHSQTFHSVPIHTESKHCNADGGEGD